MKLKSIVVFLFFLFAFLVVKSQESLRGIHNELPDDEYVQVDKSIMPRQVGYSVRLSDIITSQVNVDDNGLDIIGDAGNEPSIAVDPTNPNRIVIGWRQFDTVTSNFRQAGYGYSLDGGLTWTFPGVLNPGVFRSDPIIIALEEILIAMYIKLPMEVLSGLDPSLRRVVINNGCGWIEQEV